MGVPKVPQRLWCYGHPGAFGHIREGGRPDLAENPRGLHPPLQASLMSKIALFCNRSAFLVFA